MLNDGHDIRASRAADAFVADAFVADAFSVEAARARKRRPHGLRLARFYAADREGAAAVEFALVVIPFLIIIFGIVEHAFLIFMERTLEVGVASVARDVRVGKLNGTGLPKDPGAARNEMIKRIKSAMRSEPIVTALFDADKMRFEIREVGQWDKPGAPPADANGVQQDNLNVTPGGRESVNIMRVFYDLPNVFPLVTNKSYVMPNGRMLIEASAAFVIEP